MNTFNLYSSEGCHLCEQALALCDDLNIADRVNVIDIVEHEEYVQLYGVHIPVLERVSDKQQLFWPFSAEQIQELI